jgi:hypothetical protein
MYFVIKVSRPHSHSVIMGCILYSHTKIIRYFLLYTAHSFTDSRFKYVWCVQTAKIVKYLKK